MGQVVGVVVGRTESWVVRNIVPKGCVSSSHSGSASLNRLLARTRGGASNDKGKEGKIQGPCIGIDLGTTYSCVAVGVCRERVGRSNGPAALACSLSQHRDNIKTDSRRKPYPNAPFDVSRPCCISKLVVTFKMSPLQSTHPPISSSSSPGLAKRAGRNLPERPGQSHHTLLRLVYGG